MNAEIVKEYIRKTKHIHGWFSPGAAYLFALLDHIQKENKVTGNLFEIGVHHGKSAILMGLMANRETESLGVCDIFGDQVSNVSASGRGDRDIFLENMQSIFPQRNFLRMFEKLSSKLSPEDVTNNCRFFHIDGGHNPQEALGDLELAAASVISEGVIVVDDAFHPAWPGVTEAIFGFFTKYKGEFVPLIIGFNKLVITRSCNRSLYSEYLDNAELCWSFIPREPYALKTLESFGEQTYIFHVPTWKSEQSLRSKLYQWYFHHPQLRNRLAGATRSRLRTVGARLKVTGLES